VPLIVRGETIGAVSVQSQTPHHFDDDDLRLLRMVSSQVAVSLDNTRLLQAASQRAEQLRLVNEIGGYAVSVLDIQHLVREVVQHILNSFNYYAVAILLLENGALVPRAVARGPGSELIHVGRILTLRDRSLIAESARSGQAILVPDVSQDPRFMSTPELPETRSELTVPLTVGSEVVGILDVQSNETGGLGPEDLEMIQALAAQVAISVVNARLFAEVRSHAAQLEARVTARTAEIRSQKERTEAILRSVADAVVVLDLEGQLVLANPVAQELLGGRQGAEVVAQIGRLHSQGGVVTETFELGALSFQALASPVTLGELAVGTVVVLRDISRLRELDRLKSHFVATVSHELRTPLANIKLYLTLLQRGHEERRGQYVQVLQEETGRLSAMIEDLLDLSRLEAGREAEPAVAVELRPLLRQVLENLRPSYSAKGLHVELEHGPSPVVNGRRDQLIQVFTNLLSNSIQYTPSGGWVRLRLQTGEADADPKMACVSVQDNGQGIPDSDLPYIFDRFYRGSLARSTNLPGSGLGLAIVREILDRHQGRVTVLSRLGEGSTFSVWLPESEE
jgi:signal transduction histidine kinase